MIASIAVSVLCFAASSAEACTTAIVTRGAFRVAVPIRRQQMGAYHHGDHHIDYDKSHRPKADNVEKY